MGLIKSYFENYWKIRLLFAGIALIILGIFFSVKFDQLWSGIGMSVAGIVVVILSMSLFHKNK